MSSDQFVKLLCRAYKNRKGIFSNRINAEDLVPATLTQLSKSLFLFYVLQLDYGMKSQILYEGANKLVDADLDFFTPKTIKTLTKSGLGQTLQTYLHPRYLNEVLKRYKVNTELLVKKYKGDPRRIFADSKLAKEVEKKVSEFRGFGPKIGNFFIRSMIGCFDYDYPDLSELTQPVDIHDVRITYFLGFIDSPHATNKNVRRVKEIWKQACKKAKVSWLIFDKALWLLGSVGKPKTKEEIFNLL